MFGGGNAAKTDLQVIKSKGSLAFYNLHCEHCLLSVLSRRHERYNYCLCVISLARLSLARIGTDNNQTTFISSQ